MLGRLLESNARRERPAGGALASICLHALMLTLAVVVTARARTTTTTPDKPEILNWVTPPAPRASSPAAIPRPRTAPPLPSVDRLPLDLPSPVDISVKPIDALDAASAQASASPAESGIATPGIGSVTASLAPVVGEIFDASQVERQVSLRSGAAPRYPAALQYAGVEGRVIAQFVVDERGKADVSTLRIIDTAHELFSRSVRDVLPALRFSPAEVGGRRVSQLVQMPFDFRLNR